MDSKMRTQKLQELMETHQPHSYKELVYKQKQRKEPVYAIPVEYLIFNQYNGRIGTFVKQHEHLHGTIDAALPDDEKLIVDFLWKSKEARNKKTKEDIKKNGQLEYGIVTKDGVIIDGNRRCMIKKILAEEQKDSPTYFFAVILDETLDSNSKEIRKLETMFQMGVDAKVDYNPIEKYLKCRELISDGFDEIEIAKMMGVKAKDVKEYLDILELMEQYLEEFGYKGLYRILDDAQVEGPFVDLRAYLDKHRAGKNLQGRNWTPDETDLNDLRTIYFNMVRSGLGTHKLRHIGNPAKAQGLFNYKELWNTHAENFFEQIDPILEKETSFEDLRKEHPDESVGDIIIGREQDFKKNTQSIVKGFLGKAERDLEDRNDADKPFELLNRALATLSQIDMSKPTFKGDDVWEVVSEINSLTYEFKKALKAQS